jgi:hypothetical protein
MRLLGVNGAWPHCGYLSHWLCHSTSPRLLGYVCEKRGTIPSVSTFFSVTAPVNAPLISSAGGPTLACYAWRTIHCDTDKVDERDNNITSINFLWHHVRARKKEKYILNILSQREDNRDTRGLVWPQIVIDHRARYIPRPGLGTRRPCLTLIGYSSITSHSARGLINNTSCYARGLFWLLSDHNLTPDFLGYMWNWTHIQLGDDYFLDLATRLMPRLPASSGTTSVRCTCRCISVSSFHGVSF